MTATIAVRFFADIRPSMPPVPALEKSDKVCSFGSGSSLSIALRSERRRRRTTSPLLVAAQGKRGAI
jgi:hypothetical protein